MRLNKPYISIILIVILVVDLVFFSLCAIGKSITNKKFLESIIDKFSFYNYVITNESVKNSIDSYRYPIEVYNFIDNNKVKELEDDFANNLIEGEKVLINKNKVIEILLESVNNYDSINDTSSIEYAKKDIDKVAEELNVFFDDSLKNTYNFFKLFAMDFVLLITIVIGISIIVSVIIFERENAYLLLFIIFGLFSYILYDFNGNFLKNNWSNNEFLDLSGVTFMLDYSYIVCFILSFVLLLMYITKLIRNHLRDMRIKPYSDSWR